MLRFELAGLRRVALLLLVMTVSGCGFHWRGSTPQAQPASVHGATAETGVSVFVQTKARFSELETQVNDVLREAGMVSADSALDARWVLDVRDDKLTRRAQTVDVHGRPADYELIYSVNYAIAGAAELTAAETYRISARREYTFDAADLLGKASEEALLVTEMRTEIAQRLVQQVRYRAAQSAAPQSVTGH